MTAFPCLSLADLCDLFFFQICAVSSGIFSQAARSLCSEYLGFFFSLGFFSGGRALSSCQAFVMTDLMTGAMA